MPKTLAPPPTDRRLWRKALARVHPDSGGSEELFVWMSGVYEHLIDQAGLHPAHLSQDEFGPGAWKNCERSHNSPDRIPYDAEMDHHQRILYALRWYREAPEPYGSVVMSLSDYPRADLRPRREAKQRVGCTYRQAAFIAHLAGMSREERSEWFGVCETIGLSEAAASHIIGRLKERRAAA